MNKAHTTQQHWCGFCINLKESENMFDIKSFKKRLVEARNKNGLTQEEFSFQLGYERSSVSKYESNNKVMPSIDVIFQMADILDVSVEYLLGLETDNRFSKKGKKKST